MINKNNIYDFITLFINQQKDYIDIEDEDNYTSYGDYIIEDIELKKLYPERYNYYKKLIEAYNKTPKELYSTLKKFYRFQELLNEEKKFLKEYKFYKDMKSKQLKEAGKSGPPQQQQQQEQQEQQQQQEQQTGGYSDYKESEFRNILKNNFDMKNISKLNKKIFNNTNYDKSPYNENNNKLKNINDIINQYYDNPSDNEKKAKEELTNFENDPDNPLKELELKFDDRIIFIMSTFFIRYVSILLVQWAIDINIIKSFHEGFLYYALIYIFIFWFIVFFINIDNTTQVDYMNFDNFMNSIRSIFYYYYMGTNGVTRLIAHTILISVMIFIPIILNIKNTNKSESSMSNEDELNTDDKIIDYDERKHLIKSLSLFTIYIWILTSIIATKF
jgi:hypothetical protein